MFSISCIVVIVVLHTLLWYHKIRSKTSVFMLLGLLLVHGIKHDFRKEIVDFILLEHINVGTLPTKIFIRHTN